MAGENIRINELPSEADPNVNDVVAIDGLTTRKATLDKLVNAGRPLASQAEAEAGTDPSKAITSLTARQSMAAYAATSLATSAQGAKADSALQPAAIGDTVQAFSSRLQSLADADGVEGQVPNLTADGTLEFADAGSGDMRKNVYDPGAVGGSAFDQDNMSDGTVNKNYTGTEQTKLAGIEALADVTDAANVAAAGAAMKANNLSDVDADKAVGNIGAVAALSNKTAAEVFAPSVTPDFLQIAGYADAGDRGDALFAKTDSEPTDLPAPAIVQLLDGTFYRWSGREFPLELGAKGDGITDNKSFFADLSLAMAGYTGAIIADRGTFKTTGPLLIPANAAVFKCPHSSGALFTAAGSTDSFDLHDLDPTNFPNASTYAGVVNKIGKPPTLLLNGSDPLRLSADLATNAVTLDFAAAHGRSVNDLLLFHNPNDYSHSPWRYYYQAGEFAIPASITDSDTLKLSWGILGQGEWKDVVKTFDVNGRAQPGVGGIFSEGVYSKDTLNAYVCPDFATGVIEGIAIQAPGAGTNGVVKALHVQYYRDIIIRDVAMAGSDNSNFAFLIGFNLKASGLNTAQRTKVNTAFGTNYGGSVGNSQAVDIDTSYLEGYFEGLAVGGGQDFAIPNRHVTVRNSIGVSGPGNGPALNMHGNSDLCSFLHCKALGGMTLSGNRSYVEDIEISGADAFVAQYTEMTGMTHTLKNIRGSTGKNDTSKGLISIGGSSNRAFDTRTGLGGTINLSDIDISAPNQQRNFVLAVNYGLLKPWRIRATNVRWDGGAAVNGVTASVINVQTSLGASPESVHTANVNCDNLLVQKVGLSTADQAVTRVSGIREGGLVSASTTTSIALIDVTVAFPRAFAKTPQVVVASNSYTTSSDIVGATPLSVTRTGFTFRFFNIKAANFSAATTVNGSWTASLEEDEISGATGSMFLDNFTLAATASQP